MEKIERKLSVEEFVRRYDMLKTTEQKSKFIEDIMWRKYTPVLEKKLVLQTILKKSIVKNEKGVSYIDYFLSKINMCFAIIMLYTKLNLTDVENEEKANIYKEYDLLFERDLLNAICSFIDERELNELMSINAVLIENYKTECKSTEAVISKYVERFATLLGTFINEGLQHLENVTDKKDIKNFINSIQK